MEKRWTLRKRCITTTLLFCFAVITYLIVRGTGESDVQQSIATDVLILLFTTVTGYVFAAISDSRFNDTTDDFTLNEETQLGTWRSRRKAIFLTMAFCIVAVGFILVEGEDSVLNVRLATGLLYLHAGLLNAYVFGAVIDDNTLKNKLSGG